MATIQDLVAMGYTPQQAASLMGKSGGNSAVIDAIQATAARAGMDPKYWGAVARIESGWDPGSNAGKGTQYKGLFQVGTRGADSEWARRGSGDVFNPMDNARAAAELAAANNAGFQAHFGRAPTPAETYLMHQQGLGFFTKGTMTNIAGNLPDYARTPENMSHEGFQRWWTDRLDREANSPGAPRMATPVSSQGAMAAPGAMAAAPSTTTPADAKPGTDFASAMGAIQDRIAKEEEEKQAPQLAPIQPPQPMMTPAMLRTKQLVQAMLDKDKGMTS